MIQPPIVDTIRSRGYWRFSLRPVDFQRTRIPKLTALSDAVRASRVELTGWPYPYLSPEGPARHDEYIQDQVRWEHYLEYWRLYQSGQFVHLIGMAEDWYSESGLALDLRNLAPGAVLDLQATLYNLTEFFLFCARLTDRLELGPIVVIGFQLTGLGGRALQTLARNRVPLYERTASVDLPEISRELTVPAEDLSTAAADLAVDHAIEIYERFGWEPSKASVQEEQRRFLERRI